MADAPCACPDCEFARSVAKNSVRGVEARLANAPGSAKLAFALSSMAFAIRELRRLPPRARRQLVQSAKQLADELSAEPPRSIQ